MPFTPIGQIGTPIARFENWVQRKSGLWVAEQPLRLERGAYFVKEDRPALLYMGTLYYTSSGTFKKADYPGLRAVMVHCQGGGGGGGGCQAAGAGQGGSAGGGGGGGYVRKFILVDSLADEETVTVGAGGNGGAAGNNNGSPGGDSSFGAHAVASGGGGGVGSGFTSGNAQNAPGAGGNAPTGDIRIRGSFGGYGMVQGGHGLLTGFGGASHLGASVRPGDSGQDGISYGGGGSGARNATGAGVARPGGNGAPGIVIVEVYG